MNHLAVLPIVFMLSGAVIAVLAGTIHKNAPQVVAILTTATAFITSLLGLREVIKNGPISYELGGWPPPIGIEYVLDSLSAFMLIIVTFIGMLIAIYPSRIAFDHVVRKNVPVYPLTLLLLSGLTGVMLSGDLFHLFVFLEIFAIATYGLVALGGDRGVFASFRYLMFGTIGSGLYLLGVGFLYFSTGTLNMAEMAQMLPELAGSPTILGALGLITTGLALKMALFPLHIWLPDAHSFSPPGVAALLAAVQVKAGAYALLRILFDVFGPAYTGQAGLPVSQLLTWFGLAGIIYGSVLATRQADVKRLLAYSTVAQLGYIGVGIGIGSRLALIGAVLHVLNHALMKSALFLVAGGIIQRTGLKEIARFAGLGKRMIPTMSGFAIAALSMVGIPPLAGFWSKFYLVWAAIDADNWIVAVVIISSSMLTLVYFLRMFETIFVREATEPVVANAKIASPTVIGTVWALCIAIIVVGIANVVVVRSIVGPIADGLVG